MALGLARRQVILNIFESWFIRPDETINTKKKPQSALEISPISSFSLNWRWEVSGKEFIEWTKFSGNLCTLCCTTQLSQCHPLCHTNLAPASGPRNCPRSSRHGLSFHFIEGSLAMGFGLCLCLSAWRFACPAFRTNCCHKICTYKAKMPKNISRQWKETAGSSRKGSGSILWRQKLKSQAEQKHTKAAKQQEQQATIDKCRQHVAGNCWDWQCHTPGENNK